MGGSNRHDRAESDEDCAREPADLDESEAQRRSKEYEQELATDTTEADNNQGRGTDTSDEMYTVRAAQTEDHPRSLTDIRGIGEAKAKALREAGYETLTDISTANREELRAVPGIGAASVTQLKQATETATIGGVDGTIPSAVRDAIHETPFVGVTEFDTPAARAEAAEAAAEAETLYQEVATVVAARTRDEAVAHAMAEHVEKGQCGARQPVAFDTTSGEENDTGRLILPPTAEADDVLHELGHGFTDTFGFGRGRKSVEAEYEYRQRVGEGEIDPFISADPDDSEYLLTHEHGDDVETVPETVEAFVTAANEAWSRLHRHEQHGGELDDLTVIDNYSATSVSEFVAQMHEYMQRDQAPADDSFLVTQSAVVEAYTNVFEPSEAIKQRMAALQVDPQVKGPYNDGPFSRGGGED